MKTNNYNYIASGYKHHVFRLLGYAYKTVKEEFEFENCREHFEPEREALELLRKNGFCVPQTCEILSPYDSPFGKWTLKETWMKGAQYSDGIMPIEMEKEVFELLIKLAKNIKGDYYGQLFCDASKEYTWHSYLKDLHESGSFTRVSCPELRISSNCINELIEHLVPKTPEPVFIAMDTNLMNFFFDKNKKIVGIIDIERPIFGDFLFLLADIRWCRDHWFHRCDWYDWWVPDCYKENAHLIDLYEFLIGFQELEFRFKSGTSHPSIEFEFLNIEKKLLDYCKNGLNG